jgi:peptidoglycan hydrolase CwlO-like protein
MRYIILSSLALIILSCSSSFGNNYDDKISELEDLVSNLESQIDDNESKISDLEFNSY